MKPLVVATYSHQLVYCCQGHQENTQRTCLSGIEKVMKHPQLASHNSQIKPKYHHKKTL